MLSSAMEEVTVTSGQVLFEPGDDVNHIYFPQRGMIGALILDLRDGVSAEAAMIGFEGAVGGIISEGSKPAFTRGVMAVGGTALRLSAEVLERAKLRSPTLRDHFARYTDCLLSQVLQSVACNAVHGFDARLSRWLLAIQDRTGRDDLHLTQEFISQMLAVRRPYITRIVGGLESQGAIRKARGVITIVGQSSPN
jgi:CRP-like cAMP-binding protein